MKNILVVLLFFPGIIFSQHQERKVFVYNIGFGALTSGLGAVINKKKTENWKKSFVRGLWQGSIGGVLNYSAKKSAYLITKNNSVGYAIPARIISSAGNSIIQNAAINAPFLKNWSFEYGLFRFDYTANADKKFKVRMLPTSILATAISLPKGRLDWNTTLCTGVMVFQSKDMISTLRGSHDGINYGRAFIYMDDSLKNHIITHEFIHEFQYREYLVFNAFLKPQVEKINAPGLKNIFTKYIYPDIPYFGLGYMLEGVQQNPRFFRNYFEFEAEHFATNKFVSVN